MTTQQADVTVKKIKIEARVPLDPEALGRKELALAEKALALAKDKADAGDAARGARKRQKDLTADIKRISDEVISESTTGMVEAEERWNYDRFEVVTVRLDTSEIVSTRPMSAEERQQNLDLDLDANAPPPSSRPPPNVVKMKGRGKKGPAPAGAH